MNERHRVAQQIDTALRPIEDSEESKARILEMMSIRSQMLPIYDPTKVITAENVDILKDGVTKIVDLTYLRLKELALPYLATLQTVNIDLINYPEKLLHKRGFMTKHHSVALPSQDPHKLWFIGLAFEEQFLADGTERPVSRASFVLADSSNILQVQQDGVEINSMAYSMSGETKLIDYAHPSQPFEGLTTTIGMEFSYPFIYKGYHSGSVRKLVMSPDIYTGSGTTVYSFEHKGEHPAFAIEIQDRGPLTTNYYKYGRDGFFRRNSIDLNLPTAEEEMDSILSLLPFPAKNLSELAEWQEEFDLRHKR